MAGGSCAVGGLALARWGPPRFCLGGGELGAAVGGAASLPAHGAGPADVVRGDLGPHLPGAFRRG